jgi:hypothetical protein
LLVEILVAFVLVAGVFLLMRPSVNEQHNDCAAISEQLGTEPGTRSADVAGATLMPRENNPLEFGVSFSDRSEVYFDETKLRWQGGGPVYENTGSSASGSGVPSTPVARGDYLNLDVAPLRTPRDVQPTRQIPADSMGFYAVVIEDGVLVKFCVSPVGANPGHYSTAIRFEDPDITAAPIGVQVTVKQADGRVPVVAFLVGLALGVVLVSLKWHVIKRPPVIPLVVGGILGFLALIPNVYTLWERDATWGDDPIDIFNIFAAVALGLYGGAAVSDILAGKDNSERGNGSGPDWKGAGSKGGET